MDFNTQICTTREQSERLLAFGLKRDTCDMAFWGEYPAWSLHRLMELCPKKICLDDYDDTFYFLTIDPYLVTYEREDMDILKRCERGNVYDRMVDMVGWLVRNKRFNKEYLEETE